MVTIHSLPDIDWGWVTSRTHTSRDVCKSFGLYLPVDPRLAHLGQLDVDLEEVAIAEEALVG